MDGWGINPGKDGNATRLARTENLDRLMKEYPSTAIDTSGLSVGLPDGQMGNSEVGHLTMGSGRVVYQELTRVGKTIREGVLDGNPDLIRLASGLKSSGKALHLMGLLSDGGVHSHIEHLFGLLDIMRRKGLERIFIHAFLDGRDTPPSSGARYMQELLSYIDRSGSPARVASVMGRYYAMDRDNRWDRVKKAFDGLLGDGVPAGDPLTAINDSYARGETDEFMKPAVITEGGSAVGPLSDGDGVIFFNFRADRAREISRALVMEDFDGFERPVRPRLCGFISMTEYDSALGVPALFKPQDLRNILGEVLSRNGVRQFRVSETEKYAHVTFFFNGGTEAPFEGEDRLLIPSVKDVPTYDLKPEMRAIEIAEAAVGKIKEGSYSFILMNFANGDMVGHTGVIDAAVKACETVDRAVGMVAGAALGAGWAVIVTADHGNAEQMIDPAGGPFTAHTTNMVPFILADNEKKGVKLSGGGGLQDVAPTVLKVMGIAQPPDMTGKPLF